MPVKNGQLFLYLCLLIAVVLLMVGTRRCNNGHQLPMLTQGDSGRDTVDIAILYGPLSYYLYADTLGGLNYDMLKIMGKDTGRPIKMWPVVSLHDALKRLENGSYDMLASLPSDNSVKQRFLTTESVFLDRMVLVQLADTNGNVGIRSALDLGNDTVYIAKGSPAASRLANLSKEIGTQIPVEAGDDLSEEYLCMLVATGKVKLAVVNEKTAREMKATYPLLSYDNPVSFTQFQVWLINKSDTALQHAVDAWLKDFQSSQKYRNLIDRY